MTISETTLVSKPGQLTNMVMSVGKSVVDFADFLRLLMFHLYLYFEYACKRVFFSRPKSLRGEIILVRQIQNIE